MSLFVYDFKCTRCDYISEMYVERSTRDSQQCATCGDPLKRLMPGPTTTFKFHDRSATKSRKAVSLRDPQGGASAKGHARSLD